MKPLYKKIIDQCQQVNWTLLLYLLFFLNVKLWIKVAVLTVFIFLLQKQLIERNFLRQKFTWFYWGMIVIALLNLLINLPVVSVNYLAATATGIGFWLMCIAAAAVSFRFIHTTGTNKLHKTISLFFLINALFTICQLASFMYDAGSVNPYTYQGMNQKYFIGTGDLLKGITFDVSTTNAILNAIAVLYFLDRRKIHWLLICMAVMLMTASNFTCLLLLTVLFFQFIFQSDRNQKSIIIVCLCMLIVFFSKVSPQNKHYFNYVWQKISASKIDTLLPETTPPLLSSFPDSILNTEDKKRKTAMRYLDSIYARHLTLLPKENYPISVTKTAAPSLPVSVKPSIPKANIHTEPYQRKRDTSAYQKSLIAFAISNIPAFDTSLRHTQNQQLPGKLIALQQTISFFKMHPFKILTGTGMGQFSSKLAFRTTSLQFAGGYPAEFACITPDFRDNHLNLYLNYFSKDQEVHSLMNTPDSVYDQLLAEYGIAGIIVFMLLYASYFIRHHRKKSYALPILLLTAGAFAIGYWFEQLSIVILVELLMLLNSKEIKERNVL